MTEFQYFSAQRQKYEARKETIKKLNEPIQVIPNNTQNFIPNTPNKKGESYISNHTDDDSNKSKLKVMIDFDC